MEAPSMVHRSGDKLIIRSVVSGDQLYLGRSAHDPKKRSNNNHHLYESLELGGGSDSVNDNIEEIIDNNQSGSDDKKDDETNLPQCKIKRNYSCNNCNYFTQNPRHFLAHLRDLHGEKIIINECKHCLYASRHYQKLVRHMKMVHGSTDGLEEQAQSRKRASQLAREEKKRRLQVNNNISGAGGSISNNLSETIGSIHSSNLSSMVNSKHSTPASTSSSSSHNDQLSNQTNNNTNEILNQKFLKCTLCDYTTLYRTQMVEHEREQHNKTKFFRCQKCSYVTHIKARFSKHVKYHSMPMIKCVMCDFRTPYKWNLDRHMKNHGGAGPFKCSACNFTADIKQSLTVHEMNHHVPPVGHATGMSMARRRNKVGGTDLLDADYGIVNMGENSDGGDAMDNNNSDDAYEPSETPSKPEMYNDEIEQEFQTIPADLSHKPTVAKKPARPLPNLIPIQPIGPNDAVNLSVRKNLMGSLESLLKSDNNELRIKSNQSALRDFASLFVSEEIFDGSETSQLSPVSNASSVKRKNTNIFNELKERFAAGNGNNLLCDCGHASKCLSEAIIHKKTCRQTMDKNLSLSPINLRNVGTSTRCQYCRHRCKTSSDLYNHLQSCPEARSSAESCDSASEIESNNGKVDVSGDLTDEGMIDLTTEPHPMENKVFVWNTLPQSTPMKTNQSDLQSDQQSAINEREDAINQGIDDNDNNDDEKADDSTYYGIETAPGYGEVTKKMNPEDEAMQSSLKKVFKCPHCSFWASTASRFHVHIVGHLNKKPFECSLCSYRSNWRWDITKHIRLKTIRDVSHKSAKVLMNDETGRRNYTKYNKYITLMKVTDEDGDPKQMKSGEMTPNQEAAASANRRRIEMGADNDQGLSMDEDNPFSFTRTALLFNISNQSNNQQNVDNDEKPSDGDGTARKVSFKCKKCNFRHTNRDVVLAHVKGHYKEANLPIDEQQSSGLQNLQNVNEFNNNVYVNGILSALSPQASKLLIQQNQHMSQQNDQQLPQIRIQPISQLSGNPSHLFLAELKQQHQQQQSSSTKQPLTIPSTITQNATNQLLSSCVLPNSMAIKTQSQNQNQNQNQTQNNTLSGSTTSNNDNNEMDEASSGLNSVNGWRGTAPYRCGLCHQVSNWKHVIQRHCRLKHDGDIQIEIKLKGTNDVYQPLTMQNSNNSAAATTNGSTSSSGATVAVAATAAHDHSSKASTSTSLTGAANEVQSLSFLTKQYPIKLPVINEANNKSLVDKNTKDNVANDSTIQQLDADQRNLLMNILQKQSILCNGNILALIKSTELRCQLCNFETTNPNTLAEHIQTHLNIDNNVINLINHGNDEIIDLDDVISAETILKSQPQQSPASGSSIIATSTTTNNKQLQKIQEHQILSNGNTTDKLSDKMLREDRCPHCPYTTNKSDVLKEHMQCHICVSGIINLMNCNYCDYSIADETLLGEHTRSHFILIKNKTVAFYTCYNNLEINTNEQTNNNNNDANHQNPYANNNYKTLYPKINFDLHSSSDKENKILVDVDTGHLVK